MVVATNRGVSATALVNVLVPDPVTNHIPVPDPGADRIVAPEQVVLLSAAGSQDPDGDPLQYRWAQRSGEGIVLRDDDTVEASFISPKVQSDEVLEFSLVVIDSNDPLELVQPPELTAAVLVAREGISSAALRIAVLEHLGGSAEARVLLVKRGRRAHREALSRRNEGRTPQVEEVALRR